MKIRCVVITLLAVSLVGCAAPRGTIGALLAKDASGRVTIREAPKGLAAEQAGLLPGDEILFVNGVAVVDLTDEQLHELLSGEAGDPVKLTVTRGQKVMRLTLRRTPAQRLRVPRPDLPPGSNAQGAENRE